MPWPLNVLSCLPLTYPVPIVFRLWSIKLPPKDCALIFLKLHWCDFICCYLLDWHFSFMASIPFLPISQEFTLLHDGSHLLKMLKIKIKPKIFSLLILIAWILGIPTTPCGVRSIPRPPSVNARMPAICMHHFIGTILRNPKPEPSKVPILSPRLFFLVPKPPSHITLIRFRPNDRSLILQKHDKFESFQIKLLDRELIFEIFSSDFSITVSVMGLTAKAGGTAGAGTASKSSPVLRMELSFLKVAFSSLVKAGADSSHGSGG
ncbi:hypothetical protein QQP08_025463 [Theobroma cacao]|nr:hypothetical protein QQP08_025463 [Theobroma cacao]